jgi:hypothetical protein
MGLTMNLEQIRAEIERMRQQIRGSGKKFNRSSAPASARWLRKLCWHAGKPPSTTYAPSGTSWSESSG